MRDCTKRHEASHWVCLPKVRRLSHPEGALQTNARSCVSAPAFAVMLGLTLIGVARGGVSAPPPLSGTQAALAGRIEAATESVPALPHGYVIAARKRESSIVKLCIPYGASEACAQEAVAIVGTALRGPGTSAQLLFTVAATVRRARALPNLLRAPTGLERTGAVAGFRGSTLFQGRVTVASPGAASETLEEAVAVVVSGQVMVEAVALGGSRSGAATMLTVFPDALAVLKVAGGLKISYRALVISSIVIGAASSAVHIAALQALLCTPLLNRRSSPVL